MTVDPSMRTLIWRFRTREGSVRLGVAAPEANLKELYAELRGCAVVADTYEEFIQLAVRAVSAADGVVGDVLRQPWPERPLALKLRDAAGNTDVMKAAASILDAAASASEAEVADLLEASDNVYLLSYIRSVAHGLDEHRDRFIDDLAQSLRLTADGLIDALDQAGD